jgi:hypothetical protein
MSKNKKNSGSLNSAAALHTGEYSIIKHDLLKVVLLNAVYLAGILAIYFTDQKTHYLEKWFSKIFHF